MKMWSGTLGGLGRPPKIVLYARALEVVDSAETDFYVLFYVSFSLYLNIFQLGNLPTHRPGVVGGYVPRKIVLLSTISLKKINIVI